MKYQLFKFIITYPTHVKNASVKIECTICVTNECNANSIPNDVNARCICTYNSEIYKIWKQFQSLNTKYNMKTLPLASITFRDSVAKDSYSTARNTSLTHITLKPSNEGAGLSMTLWSVAMTLLANLSPSRINICKKGVSIYIKNFSIYKTETNFPNQILHKLEMTPPPDLPYSFIRFV